MKRTEAVHHADASNAEVKVPSLDAWEKGMKDNPAHGGETTPVGGEYLIDLRGVDA